MASVETATGEGLAADYIALIARIPRPVVNFYSTGDNLSVDQLSAFIQQGTTCWWTSCRWTSCRRTSCQLLFNRGQLVGGPVVSGPIVGGPVVDGPVVGGPVVSGPVVSGPIVAAVPTIIRNISSILFNSRQEEPKHRNTTGTICSETFFFEPVRKVSAHLSLRDCRADYQQILR